MFGAKTLNTSVNRYFDILYFSFSFRNGIYKRLYKSFIEEQMKYGVWRKCKSKAPNIIQLIVIIIVLHYHHAGCNGEYIDENNLQQTRSISINKNK